MEINNYFTQILLKLHFSFKSRAFYSMNFQGKALCLKGKEQAFYLVYSTLEVSGFWVWGPPILRCSVLMKPSNPLSMAKGDVSQSSGYFGLIGGSARTTSFFFSSHLPCSPKDDLVRPEAKALREVWYRSAHQKDFNA